MRIKNYLWMLLFAALVACGTAPAKGADGPAQTQIVATFAAQLTETAVSAPVTIEPEDAESPEETETPFASPTPDAGTLLLGRFRTVTVSQGNLFVRDGTGVPIQITKSGKDHDPIISADGQKIVFYRGDGFNETFLINADGSNEKVLINSKLLSTLGKDNVSHLIFRGTHHVFFIITRGMCGSLPCFGGYFIVDTDSNKIVELSKNVNSADVQVSPDGQYFFSISRNYGASDQIDLYRLDGTLVHSNLIPSGKSFSTFYWLSNSNGLIAFDDSNASENQNVIWRYTLKDNRAEQLILKPALPTIHHGLCDYSISAQGNWILYADSQEKIYLANLENFQSQPYKWDGICHHVEWSPNSQHFASETAIGSVDGTPPIKLDGHFIAWLDSTHYLISKGKGILDLQTYIAEVGKESAAVPTNFIWSPVYAVMP